MPRSFSRPMVLAAAVALAGGCAPLVVPSSTPQASSPTPSNSEGFATLGPSLGPLESAPQAASPGAAGFTLTMEQANRVELVLRFVAYYDARRLEEAMSLLTPDAGVSDCDYSTGGVVQAAGRAGIRKWLQKRFADHDTLVIGSILNHNPDSDRAFGVSFAGRSSDSLARLGRPKGIVPQLIAKVVFDPTGRLIAEFANGPVGAGAGEIAALCSVGGS